jgi:membrane protein insertase Oxa1/YidC/SpoIIIJ
MEIVHAVHDMTGMPYAASVAAVTVLGRIVMVPIAIWHLRNNPWEPKVLEIRTLFDKAIDPHAKARYRAEIESITRQFPRINRFALPVASLGTTLFMWVGLRRMASLYPTEMMTGGVAWFVDLTQPDPYLFLPILSCFLMFSAHELGADEMGRPREDTNSRSPLAKYALRGLTAGLFCMWFVLPSSILCFWIPHSALSCVQTVVFSQPAIIQSLGFGRGGGRTASSTPKMEDPGIRYFNKDSTATTAKDHSKTTTAGDAPDADADAEPRKTSTTPIRINKKTSKKSGRRKK